MQLILVITPPPFLNFMEFFFSPLFCFGVDCFSSIQFNNYLYIKYFIVKMNVVSVSFHLKDLQQIMISTIKFKKNVMIKILSVWQ